MKKFIPALMLLVVASTGAALAETVTLTWGSAPSGYTGNVYLKNSVTNVDGTTEYHKGPVTLPPYTATISGASDHSLNTVHNIYCLDLVAGVANVDGTYDLSTMGSSITLQLTQTDNTHTVPVTISGSRLQAIKYLLNADANNLSMQTKATMSVALWELIYQDDTHGSPGTAGTIGTLLSTDINAASYTATGGFKTDSSLAAAASTMAQNAYNYVLANPSYNAGNVYLLTDTAHQDFGFAVGGGAGVPEPTLLMSLASLGLVGLPFGIRAYRRRLA